jgi:glycosyltransferase involved in cell wall biosynthesis
MKSLRALNTQPLKTTPSSKKSPKILLVTRPLSPPWDEASKNFAFDLVKNISNQDITILTSDFNGELNQNITQAQIHAHSKNDFKFSEKVKSLLFQILKRKKFDIIHYMFTPAKLNNFAIKTFIKNKQVKTIQTIATLREDLYSPAEIKKLIFGDVIITYSKYAQQKLQKIGIKNVYQIYPGINLEKFFVEDKDEDLMEKWKIKPTDFLIAFNGEYTRLGATDLIVDTFLELWKNPANHHLKYLNACRIKNKKDEMKKNEITEKFRKAGHLDKVIFTGTFGDVNKIYNLADVIIFPINDMNGKFDVPLAMIEPYACQKPVIVSDLPILKEFSSSKINVIIPRNDKKALMKAILDLKNDKNNRKILGERAYNFAKETFNIQDVAHSYEEIYKSLQ